MAVTIMPGVQKPHCIACVAQKACWSGLRPSGGVRPSIVVTVAPVQLHREQEAAPRAGSVDEDGAGAADAVLAAHVRAGEPEVLPEKVGQGLAHRHLALDGAAVDGEADHAARGGSGQGHD